MIIMSKAAEAEISRLTAELDFARQYIDTLVTFTNCVMDLVYRFRAERDEAEAKKEKTNG